MNAFSLQRFSTAFVLEYYVVTASLPYEGSTEHLWFFRLGIILILCLCLIYSIILIYSRQIMANALPGFGIQGAFFLTLTNKFVQMFFHAPLAVYQKEDMSLPNIIR